MPEIRVVYHPAPVTGRPLPAPIDLGTDVPDAVLWIRRRLGLPPTSRLATAFTAESLDFGGPTRALVPVDAPERTEADSAADPGDLSLD